MSGYEAGRFPGGPRLRCPVCGLPVLLQEPRQAPGGPTLGSRSTLVATCVTCKRGYTMEAWRRHYPAPLNGGCDDGAIGQGGAAASDG